MRALLTLLIFSMILLSCCTNPNEEYLTQIKARVTDDAMGFDLKYKSLEFNITDTIFVSTQIDSLNVAIAEFKNFISEEINIQIDEQILVLLKHYDEMLTNIDRKNARLLSNYYKPSERINDLKQRYNEIIVNFDIDKSFFPVLKLIIDYKEYEDYYYSKPDYGQYTKMKNTTKTFEKFSQQVDSLKQLPQDKVIKYITVNKFQINNPMFNGATQTLDDTFIFDENKKIIDRISGF